MAGRRETLLAPGTPEHLLTLARELRELRAACGAPAYRRLSAEAHCAAGSLSEAASGRRLPTWEVTRAYVTGCLRHAGREDDLPIELQRWRSRWENAQTAARTPTVLPAAAPTDLASAPNRATTSAPSTAHQPSTARPLAETAVTSRARGARFGLRAFGRRLLPAVLAATVLATVLVGDTVRPPAPMTGLFNVLLLPASRTGADAGWAERITAALDAEMRTWPALDPAIQVRGPQDVGTTRPTSTTSTASGTGEPREIGAVERVAAAHGADVAVQPRFTSAGDTLTVTVELAVTGRTLAAAPEFVGAHSIRRSEPFDVVRGNLRATEAITESTMRYLRGVVAFARGLGDYTRGDLKAAETQFAAADKDLAAVRGNRREVVLLMLGNTVGKADPGRATAFYKQAVEVNPGYRRARVDLADTLRAGCDPHRPDRDALTRAVAEYTAGVDGDPVVAMRAYTGRGLARQCLDPRDPRAAEDLAEALRRYRAMPAASASRTRMEAVDALAGLARNARVNGRDIEAAAGYEEALALLAGSPVDRRTYLNRRLLVLGDLLATYRALHLPESLPSIEQQISDVRWRLCFLDRRPSA